MIGKLHNFEGKQIFACCDKELIDTKIKTKDFEIQISKHFYGTDKLTETELFNNLEICDCANIFGNNICNRLLKKKIITEEQIIKINKIAHTQIYKI
ncbi:MAG: DUF424 family protein [archaeon]|jgi:hypothetical protein